MDNFSSLASFAKLFFVNRLRRHCIVRHLCALMVAVLLLSGFPTTNLHCAQAHPTHAGDSVIASKERSPCHEQSDAGHLQTASNPDCCTSPSQHTCAMGSCVMAGCTSFALLSSSLMWSLAGTTTEFPELVLDRIPFLFRLSLRPPIS